MRIILAISILLFNCCSSHLRETDSIFINGKIYSVSGDGEIEAVAVDEGKIIKIGSKEEILALKGSKTRIIDLGGKTMTPGFIDSHAHFMGIGYAKLDLDLTNISSYEELVEKVNEKVATIAPGVWVLGRGWHQDKWDSVTAPIAQGFPTHHLLSAVSPNNPVYLRHASGHAGLANAKAMEIAGIDASTEFNDGGEIFKDEDGNPSGIFNETAQRLISKYIPDNDPQRAQMAFEAAVSACLSNGITSFHDAGVGFATIDLYKRNLEHGKLKLRLYPMLSGSNAELLEHYFSTGPEIGLGQDFLTIRSIKLYSDGALGSRGAWLLEPYKDMPATVGHSTTPVEEIYQICSKALERGFQVCTHAIGDRANREVLDQYEIAFSKTGCNPSDFRFRIEHAQHLHPDDIPRFGAMGVIPAMQAIHMSSDRPWAIDRLGKRRIEDGAYVWQKLLKSGATVINGTDAPVEPVNPIDCFYASVTRKTLSGTPPGGYEPGERMTRAQALRSYTLDAAFGAFEEDIKGSIEVGKYADFTIFDQDIMQVNEDQLLNTRVVMTIVNGEIAFDDGAISVK
ncbi:MAG: amidohydrolase [Cytophagales bacterium]|nr:amidohydrolase [Cytophagales bacterium]